MKLDKMPFIIYADIESLIQKVGNCKNNQEKSSKTKVGKHNPFWSLMPTISVFDHIKNKHSLYRGEDCMKKHCESFR